MDILQCIITYCDNYYGWNKRVFIGRDQYSDCKETVLADFIDILKDKEIYNISNHVQSNPQSYTLYGNTIRFRGIDGMGSHGKRNDIVYVNEIMEADWEDVMPLNQRCNELFICDYNPLFTVHWIYEKIEQREECKKFHSTK